MLHKYYKRCFVPNCQSNVISTPEKIFVSVPRDGTIRKKWHIAAKRTHYLSEKTHAFCCEDHFDMLEDMENYLIYKGIGGCLKVKPGVTPHKFECQARNQTIESLLLQKRFKAEMINEFLQEPVLEDTHSKIENSPYDDAVCRLCANVKSYVLPIYGEFGIKSNLANKINKHLPIRVSESDCLPLMICQECATTCCAFDEMHLHCLVAEKKLLSRLQTIDSTGNYSEPEFEEAADAFVDVDCDLPERRITNPPQIGEEHGQNCEAKQIPKATSPKPVLVITTPPQIGEEHGQNCEALRNELVVKQIPKITSPKPVLAITNPPQIGEEHGQNCEALRNELVVKQIPKITSPKPVLAITTPPEIGKEHGQNCEALRNALVVKQIPKITSPKPVLADGTSRIKHQRKSREAGVKAFKHGGEKDPGTTLCVFIECSYCKCMFLKEDLLKHASYCWQIDTLRENCLSKEQDFKKAVIDEAGEEAVIKDVNKFTAGKEGEAVFKAIAKLKEVLFEKDSYRKRIDVIRKYYSSKEHSRKDVIPTSCKDDAAPIAGKEKEDVNSAEPIKDVTKKSHENRPTIDRRKTLRIDVEALTKELIPVNSAVEKIASDKKRKRTVNLNNAGKFAVINKKHVCLMCDMEFENIESFKSHRIRECEFDHFPCDLCDESFKTYSRVVAHIDKAHNTTFPFKCDQCDKSFPVKSYLTKHAIAHSDERRYVCDACGKSYKRPCELRQHLARIHNKHMSVKWSNHNVMCEFCPKRFINLKLLLLHQAKHTGQKTCVCDRCGKAFYLESSLKQHQTLGTCLREEKISQPGNPQSKQSKHHCQMCERVFRWPSDLRLHVRAIHLNEKPYICKFCSLKFSNSSALQRHRADAHTGRKFVCEICRHRSITFHDLSHHMRSHRTDRPFSCPNCGRNYKYSGDLNKHIKKDHEGINRINLKEAAGS